jgi:hypothetical protein
MGVAVLALSVAFAVGVAVGVAVDVSVAVDLTLTEVGEQVAVGVEPK